MEYLVSATYNSNIGRISVRIKVEGKAQLRNAINFVKARRPEEIKVSSDGNRAKLFRNFGYSWSEAEVIQAEAD